MSCSYEIEAIHIPDGSIEKVEALLKKLELDTYFEISEEQSGIWLQQKEYSMSYSDADDIDNKLLPELATLIKGTDLDGQVLDTSCDDGHGVLVLANGNVHEASTFGHYMLLGMCDIPLGKTRDMPVLLTVLGIGKNSGVVVKLADQS